MNRVLAVTLLALPSAAFAQQHEIYFHQTGALLAYADAEIRILYAAITAKEFDPEIAKRTVEELDRALSAAKNNADRTTALLPENMTNIQPDVAKLRELVKAAEDQLQKLGTDIEEQTSPKEEEDDDLEAAATGQRRDWDLLKGGCGWLAVDLAAARDHYAKLAKKLKVKPATAAPKPKGKRGE
jgi:chromosome segregation ATPase